MAFVYWIHLPEHTDMLTEGYIGFTSKTVEHRYEQHKQSAKSGVKSNIYNAIRKYGDRLSVTTLVRASDDYCLDLENRLRPLPKIGWNAGVGGSATMLGYKHSDVSKANMSEASPVKGKRLDKALVTRRAESRKAKGLKHSPVAKARLRAARLALNLPPWKNPAANPSTWREAIPVQTMLIEGNRHCDVLDAYGLDRKSSAFSRVIKYIKSGWNPSEDAAYLSWLAEYTTKQGALDAETT